MLSFDLHSKRGSFELQVQAELSSAGATAIVGRNGSGKTSLLRAIAGLDQATGSIQVNDATWLESSSSVSVPTRKRKLGYVSQTPKLFPYMTVDRNLRFAYQLATNRKDQPSTKALSDVVARFELEPLLRRKPATLSGGETSRVALARALISDPALLLLDEPLSTIDLDRKRDLLPYLEGILDDRPLPMLYVTHDFTEVARLCSAALVLRDGRVLANGRVDEVIHSITDTDLPEQTTKSAIINAEYVNYDVEMNLAYFKINDQTMVIPMTEPPNFKGLVPIRIRDRDVAIATTKPVNTSIRNSLKCRIMEIEHAPAGPFVLIRLNCGTETFRATITRASMQELALQEDSQIFALIKSATLEA
ncbi:MAG: molybdenum ABC transporter ATP-binding protein [Gammaproteobacteria bacterium]|nr:molybdenum ABC transporter ATP-binding protein [Gammaproteobacteria bacterium]